MKINNYFEREVPITEKITHWFRWKFKRLRMRIKYLYLWTIIGWKYNAWDFHYTLEVFELTLRLQLEDMRTSVVKFVDQPKQERNLAICVEILRRITDHEHKFKRHAQLEADRYWDIMYPTKENKMDIFMRPETPEAKRASDEWYKWQKRISVQQDTEFKQLMTIMSKHLQRWWT